MIERDFIHLITNLEDQMMLCNNMIWDINRIIDVTDNNESLTDEQRSIFEDYKEKWVNKKIR